MLYRRFTAQWLYIVRTLSCFFLFFVIWSSYIDLMELSVLYFSPGSITQLEKFKYHPDRELRELALNLPGLMPQDLAPNSVKKYYNAFVRWQTWSKSKIISALPADAVSFCLFLALQTRLCGSISAFESIVYGVVWAHHKTCLTSPTSHQSWSTHSGDTYHQQEAPFKARACKGPGVFCFVFFLLLFFLEIQICLTCK